MSVTFIDARTGWAVGAEGTILHTTDGGSSWVSQKSGTIFNLQSVAFLDARTGWTVGQAQVMLHTSDGGETWQGGEAGTPFVTYARYPAPWWYLAFLGGLMTATIALRPPGPLIRPVGSVADLALSDKPIEAADRDVMSFRTIALGLSSFLRNTATEPPVTLAITGDWGSGKSSMMNLLRADLADRGFRPVWFNAWHQQKETGVLAALVSAIRAQALPALTSVEGMRFRVQLMGERIRERPLTTAAMTFLAAWSITYFGMEPSRLTTVLELLPQLGSAFTDNKGDAAKSLVEHFKSVVALAAVLGPLLTALRGLRAFGVNPGALANSVAGSLRQAGSQTKVLLDYARQFRDVTRALDPRTLTIFIDDLDRCTPERVRETLEAVNYLVSSGPCFIVLGMARERVEACVGLAFKDVAQEMVDLARLDGSDEPAAKNADDEARRQRRRYARDYLKKLVNIEVPVPEPTDSQTRQLVSDPSTASAVGAGGSKAAAAVWNAFAAGGLAKWPLALVVVFLIAGWWVASRTPDVSPLEIVVPASTPDGPALATTPSPVPAPAPIAPAPANAAADVPVFLVPGQRAAVSGWVWVIPIALLAAAVVGVRLRRPNVVEHDSTDFRDALSVWLPLVAVRQNTPREVKRYVNRVRLLAMRQRAETDPEGHLDEYTLVALGALHHIDESLLDSLPAPDTGATVGATLVSEGHAWANRLGGILDTAISEHLLNASWPPSAQAVQRFRALAGRLRINR